jgi:hypothetical protein
MTFPDYRATVTISILLLMKRDENCQMRRMRTLNKTYNSLLQAAVSRAILQSAQIP